MLADRLSEHTSGNTEVNFDGLPYGISVDAIFTYLEGCIEPFYAYWNKKRYNEEQINDRFIRFANQDAISNYPFRFIPEPRSDDHSDRHRPDLGVYPAARSNGIDILFVIEMKRLPPQESNREYEYVLGNKRNGGIERFKLGIHGKGFVRSGLIGYVERDDFDRWQTAINHYIIGLSNANSDPSLLWDPSEQLQIIYKTHFAARFESIHDRGTTLQPIVLHHLWINFTKSN